MTDYKALHEAATGAPWHSDGPVYSDDDDEKYEADVALVVALRNGYASGNLIERSKVERLVEAVRLAVRALDYCPCCDSSLEVVTEGISDAQHVLKAALESLGVEL